MTYIRDHEPLLPPKSRDGIENGVRWIFAGMFIVALFVLVIAGMLQAERTSVTPPAPAAEAPEAFDLGTVPE